MEKQSRNETRFRNISVSRREQQMGKTRYFQNEPQELVCFGLYSIIVLIKIRIRMIYWRKQAYTRSLINVC